MGQGKTYKVLIVVSLILVIIVTGFTGGLNAGSFKKNYTNSLVASYAVVGVQSVRKIEYALKYGKPLANFYGLTEILQEAKEESAGLKNIRVVLKDGVIINDLNQVTVGRMLPQPLLPQNSFKDGGETGVHTYLLYGHDYHIFIPIYGQEASRIGSMEMIFSEAIVNYRINQFLKPIIGYSTLLCLVAIAVLIFFILKFQIVTSTGDIKRRLLLITMAIVLGLTQIAFGVINYSILRQAYTEIARENSTKTAVLIQKDINRVIRKGVTYRDLDNIQPWLKDFVTSTPEIERIDITNQQNSIRFSAHSGVQSSAAGSEFQLTLPLQADANQTAAGLKITLSREHIAKKLSEIALDMLTVLITAFIFMMEVIFFVAVVLKKSRKDKIVKDHVREKERTDVLLVRPLVFIFYFSAFMSMTFIPVLMKELYQPIWGLSKNVVFGLPISAELLCGALAALLAGFLMEISGWKPVFFLGLAFFGCGAYLSGIAQDAVTFIVARGVFGVGYGFSLLAMQGFVNSAKSNNARSKGIVTLTSGSYAGINCGCVLGAMLADRIGYSGVFFVTLFGTVLAGVYVLVYMKNNVILRTQSAAKQSERLSQFFGDRKLWTFFLFIVIPVAVCPMFLEYFLPLYSKTAGVSAADVGRVFLLNGLTIVYLGPPVSRFVRKHVGLKQSIILSASIAAAAMLIFACFNSFGAACVSAIVLGIAIGFGDAAQNNYLLSLGTTKILGGGVAVGFLNVASKIGQTVGPVLFGALMILGSAISVGIVGWSVIALLVLFIILSAGGSKACITGSEAPVGAYDGK